MIIKYEIEQFLQEIENKLPQLSGIALEKALEKVAVLNRVNIEFMEYEDLMRKLAIQHSNTMIESIRMMQELQKLRTEVNYLKENING